MRDTHGQGRCTRERTLLQAIIRQCFQSCLSSKQFLSKIKE